MRRVAALLAAALLCVGLMACGGGGAEPGAPRSATLVLDFQPNAVHSGIYAAEANGYFEDDGVDLTIREPSSTADSAKLLESGRADFAILDISDFGIAQERGLTDIVPIAAVVQRPLASVIARDSSGIRTPSELAGKTIGVTGVPSDDAVLDTVLRSGGVDPSDIHRVTIGFNAVASLVAGKVDAATAFWNAEGVQLQQMGVPIREFRVDEFGAPRYPELLVVVRSNTAAAALTGRVRRALVRGYRLLAEDPQAALDDLLSSVDGLDAESQRAQLDALLSSRAFASEDAAATPELDPAAIDRWQRWASAAGLLGR
jgi:putative hydroxymethylpyrimidine transport system substrate-binding protein